MRVQIFQELTTTESIRNMKRLFVTDFSNLSSKLQSKIRYRIDQTLLERSWSVLAGKGGQEIHATGGGRDPG